MDTTPTAVYGQRSDRWARVFRYAFIVSLVMLAVSGFAQMPIFKRYYVADIPGLGWLDRFYVTHYLHYLFAVLFLGLASAYCAYWLLERRRKRLTVSGTLRAGVLAGITFTGVLMVVKNLATVTFAPQVVIGLDLAHLSLVMALLGISGYAAVFGKRWVREFRAES